MIQAIENSIFITDYRGELARGATPAEAIEGIE